MSSSGSATPSRQATEVRRTELDRWREDCLDELDRGGRFCGAYAAGDGDDRRWNALFAHGSTTCLLSAALPSQRPAPSLVDLLPAADWDEREAHDLERVDFEGLDWVRARVDRSEATASCSGPGTGEGARRRGSADRP